MGKKIMVMVIAISMLLVVIMSGCSQTAPATSSAESSSLPAESSSAPSSAALSEQPSQSAQELKTVKIGCLPYFDYTLFAAAKALGLDKEQGLNFELVPFTLENQATQALLNGSIDIAQGAIGSFVPLIPKTPDLRIILTNNQFKGFIYIGREGKIKTFMDFYMENGGDFAKAQTDTLTQFKDKKILMVESSFSSMLKSALEKVGMKYEDVKVVNFKDDASAATAFLRGEGDLYTGSLVQEMKLMATPGYVNVAGNEVLGDAGLWFSNTAVLQEYLDKNRDVVDKLIAIHYKASRYLYSKDNSQVEKVIQPMLDYLKQNASSDLTMDQAKQIKTDFEAFFTIEESKTGVYGGSVSPIYWKNAGDLFVSQNEALGNIEKGSVDLNVVVQQEKLFNDLLKNQQLLDWINAPLK